MNAKTNRCSYWCRQLSLVVFGGLAVLAVQATIAQLRSEPAAAEDRTVKAEKKVAAHESLILNAAQLDQSVGMVAAHESQMLNAAQLETDRASRPIEATLKLRDELTGVAHSADGMWAGRGPKSKLKIRPFNRTLRDRGDDWCDQCYTMIGTFRLDSLRSVLENTIRNKVPGDFVEAGTWRGGASIYARAVHRHYGEDQTRRAYMCDSFAGLPVSSTHADRNVWVEMSFLSASMDDVKKNFEHFGLLDDNTHFVKGFFKDTLPELRINFTEEGRQISVLRGDGDMFESYFDIMFNLYEFIPVGGFFICDDCGSGRGIPEADKAIEDFRNHHGITDKLEYVQNSGFGLVWQKEKMVQVDHEFYATWKRSRHFAAPNDQQQKVKVGPR